MTRERLFPLGKADLSGKLPRGFFDLLREAELPRVHFEAHRARDPEDEDKTDEDAAEELGIDEDPEEIHSPVPLEEEADEGGGEIPVFRNRADPEEDEQAPAGQDRTPGEGTDAGRGKGQSKNHCRPHAEGDPKRIPDRQPCRAEFKIPEGLHDLGGIRKPCGEAQEQKRR